MFTKYLFLFVISPIFRNIYDHFYMQVTACFGPDYLKNTNIYISVFIKGILKQNIKCEPAKYFIFIFSSNIEKIFYKEKITIFIEVSLTFFS